MKDNFLQLEYLKQWDPRWRDVIIGHGPNNLGAKGCAVTDLGMITERFGCKMSPAEIAGHKEWFQSDSLVWIALRFKNFSFRWREGNLFSKNPKDVDMNLVKAWINPNSNRMAILETANGTHWVLALWVNYDGDIVAVDPMTGKTCEVNKTYGPVTGASLFIEWDKSKHGGKEAWQGTVKPVAPSYD